MDSRRKAEIEAKKQKLAELRKARLERQATLAQEPAAGSLLSRVNDANPTATSRAQLEEIVKGLLSPASGPDSPRSRSRQSQTVVSVRTGNNAANAGLDRPLAASGRGNRLSNATLSERDRSAGNEDVAKVIAASGPAGSVASEPVDRSDSRQTPDQSAERSLDSDPAPLVVFKPKVTTYEKGIQTTPVSRATGDDNDDEFDGGSDDEASRVQAKQKARAAIEAEIRAKMGKEFEMQRDIERLEDEENKKQLERRQQEALPITDLNTILASPEFQTFIDDSSKILERALNDNYDYLRDYSIGDSGPDTSEAEQRVRQVCKFYDERWCQNRSVTSLDWSPKFPELCVAAYNKNAMSITDPDGIVCVWNMHLVERPEFVFHSQSDVLSVVCSPFHSNLIVGGTYAGQILIWDTRAKSPPVLKSPLSSTGHTHPVYSLNLVGTQNAHNLVSASTDGTICSWSLDMLARPQELLHLLQPQHPKTDEVSITSMAFRGNETTTLLVGTEEGIIHGVNRYDRAGAKAGLLPGDVYKAHSGPVLGLDYHPLAGPIDFSDLFLSCGVDWTVRLWRTKASSTRATPCPPGSTPQVCISPIRTFEEASNYILDARWHSAHPAIFGTVGAAGTFDLWNLNSDTEIPLASIAVGGEGTHTGLNKLAWEKREGRHAAIGSSDGRLHIYDIGTIARPRDNEWDLLRRNLQQLSGLSSRETTGR